VHLYLLIVTNKECLKFNKDLTIQCAEKA